MTGEENEKMGKDYRFEIQDVYQQEAEDLILARKKSNTVHKTGDISASGDEVEVPVRDFFSRRLPSKYYVGHGHIVDRLLATSPQLDLIVADNSATPLLLESENGTQYFPYESVYLVGEVKSTFVKSKEFIADFSEKLKKTKTHLQREPTPPNYIGGGIALGAGLVSGCKETHRNPLFSFMLFVDSNDQLDADDLAKQYSQIPDLFIPNIVCFLDGYIIAKAEVLIENGKSTIGNIEVNCHRLLSREDVGWTLFDITGHGCNGQALATLMSGIFQHLGDCVLMLPPAMAYLQHVLRSSPVLTTLIDVCSIAKVAEAGGLILDDSEKEDSKKKIELNSTFDPITGKEKIRTHTRSDTVE